MYYSDLANCANCVNHHEFYLCRDCVNFLSFCCYQPNTGDFRVVVFCDCVIDRVGLMRMFVQTIIQCDTIYVWSHRVIQAQPFHPPLYRPVSIVLLDKNDIKVKTVPFNSSVQVKWQRMPIVIVVPQRLSRYLSTKTLLLKKRLTRGSEVVLRFRKRIFWLTTTLNWKLSIVTGLVVVMSVVMKIRNRDPVQRISIISCKSNRWRSASLELLIDCANWPCVLCIPRPTKNDNRTWDNWSKRTKMELQCSAVLRMIPISRRARVRKGGLDLNINLHQVTDAMWGCWSGLVLFTN